jgi:hypothetical protein
MLGHESVSNPEVASVQKIRPRRTRKYSSRLRAAPRRIQWLPPVLTRFAGAGSSTRVRLRVSRESAVEDPRLAVTGRVTAVTGTETAFGQCPSWRTILENRIAPKIVKRGNIAARFSGWSRASATNI